MGHVVGGLVGIGVPCRNGRQCASWTMHLGWKFLLPQLLLLRLDGFWLLVVHRGSRDDIRPLPWIRVWSWSGRRCHIADPHSFRVRGMSPEGAHQLVSPCHSTAQQGLLYNYEALDDCATNFNL